MGTLGGHLREMRESRGASLDEMARTTRVGKSQLEALEADDLGELPAPVFVKGFIRAYCGFLRASPEEALERYRDLLGEGRPVPRASTRQVGAPPWSRGPVVLSLVLLVLLAGGLLAVNAGLRGRSHPSVAVPGPDPTSAPPSAAPVAPGAPASPAASAPTPAGRPAPASARGVQRLVVKALEPTWVRVQIDGGGSVQELLPAGASREWSAEERFVLTVGNAGGLQLELNGRTLPPLGERGAVIRELVLPQGAASTGS